MLCFFSHEFCSIFFDLVTRCLEIDPKNRVSAKQALEHDFFRHVFMSISTPFHECSLFNNSLHYLISLVVTYHHRLPMKNTPRVLPACPALTTATGSAVGPM
jgi:serine/threonine protein kinase